MVTAVSIVKKGYFPRELPPPFTTRMYGNLVYSKRPAFPEAYNGASKPLFLSLCSPHNLARVGALRRELQIPNPVNFLQLATQTETDWVQLAAHCGKSKLSLSTPDLTTTGGRAIGRKRSLNELPNSRAAIRATARYVLKTDISSFYPTLYTHSIPWALNTKATAKAGKHSSVLLGNELDRFVRNGQDGQTIGIPIGPDTSLVLAETILTAVDVALSSAGVTHGFRYMDDFELGFTTYAEAEQTLATLQGVLNEFELQLNPAKTHILDLPAPIEPSWVSELRVFPFHTDARRQRFDLIRYFDRAFELAGIAPRDPVLKYAVSRMDSETIDKGNWTLYQHLLLQCASSESGTLPFVIDQLKYYADQGYVLDTETIRSAFSNIIVSHAPLGHGSEVAWAVWGSILFATFITPSAVEKLINIEDSVVALLALDANSLGLLGAGFASPLWSGLMTDAELAGDQWLLAYEANVQGWLGGVGGTDNVSLAPAFKFLKDEGIRFYDRKRRETYRPRKALIASWLSSSQAVSG